MPQVRGTRHQKFLKSEKAKVKLKGKKELPKGTNVTNTTFKVKRIVVHSRGANTAEEVGAGPTLSELVSRLQHASSSQRTESLAALRHRPAAQLQPQAARLLAAIAPLVLDQERSVRREAYQTLHALLSPLSSEKITPFFDILCSYLRCAMTHINIGIHEDSLFYFDVLLECAPELLARNIYKIFPTFIDMISKLQSDSKPGRTLSMNLGSKLTSVKWRTKVLLRLSQFLRIIINMKIGTSTDCNGLSIAYLINNYYMSGNKIDKCTYNYNPNERAYFPINNVIKLSKINLSKNKNVNYKEAEDKNDIHHFVDILTPLLFDAWLEVRPESINKSDKTDSTLTEESMTILEYITDIILVILYLLQISDKESRTTEFTENFITKYRKTFKKMIFTSFPYSQGVVRSKNAQNQNNNDKYTMVNLTICHIYTLIHGKILRNSHCEEIRKTVHFVNWSIDHSIPNSLPFQMQIIGIVTTLLKCEDWTKSPEMASLLDKLIFAYKNNIDDMFKRHIFTLFCQIFLNNNTKNLQFKKSFDSWLNDLPNMICNEKSINSKSFDVIMRFAIQHNKLFNDSIKEKLMLMMKNLPNIDIVDMPDKFEAKKKVLSLLYWVNRWDTESLNILQDQLSCNIYEIGAKEYLVDILQLKSKGIFPK